MELAGDGAEAESQLANGSFDVVILDAMMPRKGGFELLRDLHGSSYPPTIVISARGEEVDRMLGFELGADDYLPKPFNPRELVIRVRALLRRALLAQKPIASAIGNLVVCAQARRAQVEERSVPLTNAEFKILLKLLEAQGVTVRREVLSELALGRACLPGDRSVDTHISNLRRKLKEAGARGFRINAERNLGYGLLPT